MNGFVAMFRKELTQMVRDRGTLFFALLVPVLELVLFGVIDMNAKNIPTAVLDLSQTQESRSLRALSAAVRRQWLRRLLPQRTALLRAPYIEQIILEDWLLANGAR